LRITESQFSECSPLYKRLRVLESFVNVDSFGVRCLALAVLRQHVAVALGFVALVLALALVIVTLVLALALVALLTSLLKAYHWSRHRLQWFIHLQARGLRKGDEHHLHSSWCMAHFTFT